MKIGEAIKKARKKKRTISSKKAGMYLQSPKTLTGWLFSNNTSEGERISTFVDILRADDWKVDGKESSGNDSLS